MTAALSHRESDVTYHGVIAILNDRWRVILCKDGIQWILQRQDATQSLHGAPWRGQIYIRTRAGLIRVSHEHAGEIDAGAMSILNALPEAI